MRPIERLHLLLALHKGARYWPADAPVPPGGPGVGWVAHTFKSGPRKGQQSYKWTGERAPKATPKPKAGTSRAGVRAAARVRNGRDELYQGFGSLLGPYTFGAYRPPHAQAWHDQWKAFQDELADAKGDDAIAVLDRAKAYVAEQKTKAPPALGIQTPADAARFEDVDFDRLPAVADLMEHLMLHAALWRESGSTGHGEEHGRVAAAVRATARGLLRSAWGGQGDPPFRHAVDAFNVAGAGFEVTTIPLVAGIHHADGRTALASGVVRDLAAFFRDPKTSDEKARNAMTTLLHEELHGVGRPKVRSWYGQLIEECTTELVGRATMARLFPGPVGEASYDALVGLMSDAVQGAIRDDGQRKVPEKRLAKALTEASVAYKWSTETTDVRDDWVESVREALGAGGSFAGHFRRRLDALERDARSLVEDVIR